MIRAIYDRIWPAPALKWEPLYHGVLVSGKYRIIADRHVPWENDLLVDGEWCYQATTVDRLMQIAANHKRRNGHE